MSLLGRIGKFAESPQGKKLVKQAQDLAKDPDTKKRIDEARERLMHRGKTEQQQAKTNRPAA